MRSYTEAFLVARQSEGCTRATLSWHRSCLNKFCEWIENEVERQTIDCLNPLTIRQYIVWLQNSDLSQTSVATYVRSLRAFLTWLYDEELIERNIALKVKEPRTPQIEKQPFTQSELRGLLQAATTTRDKAIVAVLIDTGIRASELCTLRRESVILNQRLLLVQGKGQKQRVVPISPKTAALLSMHMLKEDGDFVFMGLKGRFTPNGLLQLCYRLGEKAGVKNVHPHRFRHTFAISFLRNGGDSLMLQRILGHAILHMTNHYLHTQREDLQRSHAAASPLASVLRG